MTKFFLSLLPLIILFSCSNPENKETTYTQKATNKTIRHSSTSKATTKYSFKNIQEVIEFAGTGTWVNTKAGLASCKLYFNSENVGADTLDVEYSPECWLSFPYKVVAQKIIVYWDKIIDSKYNFNIVKAINEVVKNYKGRPFMILELLNDTTLQATYPDANLIKKLNASDKERLLFPTKYNFSQMPL